MEHPAYGDPRMPQRFWDRVEDTGTCWLWTGPLFRNGYGQYRGGEAFSAHRCAYIALVGLEDRALVIDHVCRVKTCVNPRHMDAVTTQENVNRGMAPYVTTERNASKTHCAQGHEFTIENTRFTKNRYRVCKACAREWDRTKQQRAKAGDIRPVGRPKVASQRRALPG